ncbi:MAG: hypothetical protein HGB12_13905 [Bacteroidetes bacterium]|nr:hypothetical protein [Bacteroidota bacterium]
MENKDSILYVFAEEYSKNIFKEIGVKMLDMAIISEEHFKKFGKKEVTFKRIKEKLDIIAQRGG